MNTDNKSMEVVKNSTHLQELVKEYGMLLQRKGSRDTLINIYESLEGWVDLEGQEIEDWYNEDKDDLPIIKKRLVEVEKELDELIKQIDNDELV